jgi:hypothetical protein
MIVEARLDKVIWLCDLPMLRTVIMINNPESFVEIHHLSENVVSEESNSPRSGRQNLKKRLISAAFTWKNLKINTPGRKLGKAGLDLLTRKYCFSVFSLSERTHE